PTRTEGVDDMFRSMGQSAADPKTQREFIDKARPSDRPMPRNAGSTPFRRHSRQGFSTSETGFKAARPLASVSDWKAHELREAFSTCPRERSLDPSGVDRSRREVSRNQCGFRQNAARTRTCRVFPTNQQFAASRPPTDLASDASATFGVARHAAANLMRLVFFLEKPTSS